MAAAEAIQIVMFSEMKIIRRNNVLFFVIALLVIINLLNYFGFEFINYGLFQTLLVDLLIIILSIIYLFKWKFSLNIMRCLFISAVLIVTTIKNVYLILNFDLLYRP